MDPRLHQLERYGVHFMGMPDARLIAPHLAMDAQPGLVTTTSSGIPSFLLNFIDPKFIETLLQPLKAVEIAGSEEQKGSWLTASAQFPTVEYTGTTSVYGDYNESGGAGVNVNWPSRESYHWQTFYQVGQKELEIAGEARIDLAAQLRNAIAVVMARKRNKSYWYGIAGLQLFGILNDPGLLPAIEPATKVITTDGKRWTYATAIEVYEDAVKLFTQLQTQMGGNIDTDAPMVLALSPTASTVGLTKTNIYNVKARELITTQFPNIKIVTAPEMATDAGELVRLTVPEWEGQQTATCAYTELSRTHPMITRHSAWSQKVSAGTWGYILFRPVAVASMLGV